MAPFVTGGSRSTAALTGQFAWPMINFSTAVTESQRLWPIRKAGSFSRMIGVFDANGTARTFVLRKNSANSGVVITATDTTAGTFKDYTNIAHYAVGDTYDVEPIVTGTGFACTALAILFSADVGTFGVHASVAFTTTASTTAIGVPGALANLATELKLLVRAPGTWSNLVGSVSANAATGTNVATARKNSLTTSMTYTVGAGLTGIFEDTTHSDIAASGDTIAHQVVTAAASAITMQVGVSCTYSTDASELSGGSIQSIPFSASNQFIVVPTGGNLFATESSAAIALGIDGVLSQMRLQCITNTMTGTFTYNLRKNGVTGNQTLAIATTATGTFEDTTHTDTFVTTDTLAYMVSGGVSGAFTQAWLGMTMTPVPTAASWVTQLALGPLWPTDVVGF